MPSISLTLLPEFNSLIDQGRPLQQLGAALSKRTVSHALLFTGIEGVGRNAAARMFAMACNCIEGGKDKGTEIESAGPAEIQVPCGRCRSCRKIQSGNHPDIVFVKPSGALIKIGQIRDLCRTLTRKPFEARERVVIISDAEAMNLEAGNALLKVLEEPPDRTKIILISKNANDLLPTVVSRCQQIRFKPIGMDRMKAFLETEYGIDDRQAAILSQMAGGSLSKALSMMKGGWIERRNWLIDEVISLPSKSVRMALLFAEQLSKQKEALQDSLEIVKIFIRDLVVYRYRKENIINQDLKEKIYRISQEVKVPALLAKVDAIQATQRRIESNANLRLALEVLMIQLRRN